MKNRLFATGAILTFLWLLFLALLVCLRWQDAAALRLNEWGDFFAGFFSPVAFLWLVLGFLQQGKELQLSTSALELQAQELQHSVEQQRQLVEVTRLQVDTELTALKEEQLSRREAAQPKFVMGGVGGQFSENNATYHTDLKNVGNTATDLEVTLLSSELGNHSLGKLPSLSRGESMNISITYHFGAPKLPAEVRVTFVDAEGIPGEVIYDLAPGTSTPNPMITLTRRAG